MERLWVNICSIDLGDVERMLIKLDLKLGKCTNVDDAQPVTLSSFEVDLWR